MSKLREENERIREWIGIGSFSILLGMLIIGVLLVKGTLP